MNGSKTEKSGVQRPGEQKSWPNRLTVLVLILASAIAMSKNLADADLWGHVTFGMNVLDNGQLPETATYTFTAVGYPWINHENLSELTLATVSRAAGGAGLLVFKCLLGIGLLGWMVHLARRHRVDIVAICIVITLVAVNLTASWTLRPQLFSYCLFAVLMALLDSAFRRFSDSGEIRFGYLWAVIPLLFVWANAHGGFVAGCALLVLYLICRSGELLFRRGKLALPTVARLAMVAVSAGLATLINPYSVNLHRWLFESLRRPRPEITEWATLTFGSDSFVPFAVIMAVSVLALVKTKRRRELTHMVLLAVTAYQSVLHVRHIPFFAILVGFWLPLHVESLLVQIRKKDSPSRQLGAARLALPVGLTFVAIGLAAMLGGRLRELWVDKTEFPVDAIRFMAENNLDGRLVVTYNWAQYALASLGPETTVAFDGRFRTCYPQSVVDMHFDLVLGDIPAIRWRGPSSSPVDGQRVLQHLSPDLALVDRSQQNSVIVLSSSIQWVLLYQDGQAQVWGRRSRFDDPGRPDYLSPSRRRIENDWPSGYARWPAFPRSDRS